MCSLYWYSWIETALIFAYNKDDVQFELVLLYRYHFEKFPTNFKLHFMDGKSRLFAKK